MSAKSHTHDWWCQAGADPAVALNRFAENMAKDAEFHKVSLGQGQGPYAERLVASALEGSGSWVLLQNCHLAPSWMLSLQNIVEDLASREKLPKEFRLWLTCAPSHSFPMVVLRRGVKVTNEPPRGVRANLLGSYLNRESTLEAEELAFHVAGVDRPTLRTLHYGLCVFHAIVQERRKFGCVYAHHTAGAHPPPLHGRCSRVYAHRSFAPLDSSVFAACNVCVRARTCVCRRPLGWNTPYSFNSSDLDISARQLRHFLKLHVAGGDGGVPFDALQYMTCELNYGGRITDECDRRLCAQLLSAIYTPDLFSDGYNFSPSGVYQPPPPGASLEETRLHILDLPLTDLPEVFGECLHAMLRSDTILTASVPTLSL